MPSIPVILPSLNVPLAHVNDPYLHSQLNNILSHSQRVVFIRHYTELQAQYNSIAHRGKPLELLLPCPSNPSLTIGEFLCARAREGPKYKTTSHLCGITPKTVQNWLTRGRAIAHQLEIAQQLENEQLTIAQQLENEQLTIAQLEADTTTNNPHYFKFYLDYREAEAHHKYALEQESVIRALEGTEKVISHEVIVTCPTTGDVLARHEVVTARTITRDGKAARELLAIADPDYSPVQRRELKHTGTGEHGEIEHTTKSHVNLRERLSRAPLDTQVQFLRLMDELSEVDKRANEKVIEVDVTTLDDEE